MNKNVYIETTVISYLTARLSNNPIISGRQRSTRIAWPKIIKNFDCFISILVHEEAKKGNHLASKKRLEIVNKLPILELSLDSQILAQKLISKKAIPREFPEDALHISLATCHKMNYILTWNFKHINNATMKSKINTVIEALGFHPPTICTPEELLGGLS